MAACCHGRVEPDTSVTCVVSVWVGACVCVCARHNILSAATSAGKGYFLTEGASMGQSGSSERTYT